MSSETTFASPSTRCQNTIALRPSRLQDVNPRSLSEFTHTKELITVMMQAMSVHRKLHDVAGILHGDISPNTIVIMENPTDGKVEGALIDLDKPLTPWHKHREPHM